MARLLSTSTPIVNANLPTGETKYRAPSRKAVAAKKPPRYSTLLLRFARAGECWRMQLRSWVVLPIVIALLALDAWLLHRFFSMSHLPTTPATDSYSDSAAPTPSPTVGTTATMTPTSTVSTERLPKPVPASGDASAAIATFPPAPANWQSLPGPERVASLLQRRTTDVSESLRKRGFTLGDALYLRIMKESNELELWLQPRGFTAFQLYKTFRIARWSGTPGPKQREGDGQAPEGFYLVTGRLMNPQSTYHLSFNIGYPNAFDRALNRTGGLIMVHGKDVSIGCFAMTDPVIEEIYLIAQAALAAGQPAFAVHCFPFRMTAQRLAAADGPWVDFWRNLKQGWDQFEQTHVPPDWKVQDGRYVFP